MLFFENSTGAPLSEQVLNAASYSTFQTHPNAAGKSRLICAPNNEMREVHKKLIGFLRTHFGYSEHSYGGLPGNSPLRTIEFHRDERGTFPRYWYASDIRDAFPSVSLPILSEIITREILDLFRIRLRESEVLSSLVRFCSIDGTGLVLGLPASCDLWNLYAHNTIDASIKEYLTQINRYQQNQEPPESIIYTRYVDDLIFSRSFIPLGHSFRKRISHIVREAGLALSEKKTRVGDLDASQEASFEVLGISLNRTGKVFLSKRRRDEIEAALQSAFNDEESAVSALARYDYFDQIHQVSTRDRRLIPLTHQEKRLIHLRYLVRRRFNMCYH